MSDDERAYKKPALAAAWSAAGLVLSFLLALGMDAVFRLLRAYVQSTFHVLPGALFQAVSPLILAGILLALAWLLFVKLEQSRLCASIFLVPGLLVLGVYATQFLGFPVSLRGTLAGQLRYFIIDLGTRSNLFHLASFSVVAGIVAFVRASQAKPPIPSARQ